MPTPKSIRPKGAEMQAGASRKSGVFSVAKAATIAQKNRPNPTPRIHAADSST
jgi:hypothetical protein